MMEKILGVKVDNLNQEEVLDKIAGFLIDGRFHQIATVGPEFILEAQKNEEFRQVLNNCDLNVADGFGIRCAFWRFRKHLKARFAGIDLMHEILKIANERGLNVFLACNIDGLSTWEETRDAISKLYPKLKINGVDMDCHSELVEESNKIKLDPSASPPAGGFAQDDKNKSTVIFANFGAPDQEIFLDSLKNDMIGVVMGVGGSFDFITGKVRRAPKFMRQIGLEWLWRLFQQPRRWKRIWNAVAVFPIKVILNK